jgi:hypothetical protein
VHAVSRSYACASGNTVDSANGAPGLRSNRNAPGGLARRSRRRHRSRRGTSRHAHSSCAYRPNGAPRRPIFHSSGSTRTPLRQRLARLPKRSAAIAIPAHPSLRSLRRSKPHRIDIRCPPHQRLPSNRSIRPAPRQPHLTTSSSSCGAAPIVLTFIGHLPEHRADCMTQ